MAETKPVLIVDAVVVVDGNDVVISTASDTLSPSFYFALFETVELPWWQTPILGTAKKSSIRVRIFSVASFAELSCLATIEGSRVDSIAKLTRFNTSYIVNYAVSKQWHVPNRHN